MINLILLLVAAPFALFALSFAATYLSIILEACFTAGGPAPNRRRSRRGPLAAPGLLP